MSFSKDSMISGFSKAGVAGGSVIRKMFTQGLELKQKYGADNVFDFSLGNPALEPPKEFEDALKEVVNNPTPMMHGYCPNSGIPECREAVAKLVCKLQNIEGVTKDDVCITVGAAGAMSVTMKTILDIDDEVIVFKPFFGEYNNYVKIHGGKIVPIATDEHFLPSIPELEKAITAKTRAVIINSPNNPTGKVYPQSVVDAVGKVLLEASKKNGRPIYLISDEPYAQLIYSKEVHHHSAFKAYEFAIVCSSFSKDLSIPGERCGYIVPNPTMQNKEELIPALSLWNRCIGFVNSTVLIQRAVAKSALANIDVSWYAERRARLVEGLRDAGIEFTEPEGAFYFFPKVPAGVTDTEFCDMLAAKNVLLVPGSAFGDPTCFRLCYCVEMKTIEGALPIIKKVVEEIKARK